MYYSVENKTDKEVGNVFPQVSCINQDLAHSIKYNEFVNLDSELLFELQPKAKLTDVLSQAAISSHGLLINEKLKAIVSEFNTIQYRYYKCIVKDKENLHNYYWLHLMDDLTNVIDYTQSVFYWTKSTFRKGLINLTSYNDYLSKKKENGILWGVDAETIHLNQNFDRNTDLFGCLPFDMHIYISDKLKTELEKKAVTGILISKAPNII